MKVERGLTVGPANGRAVNPPKTTLTELPRFCGMWCRIALRLIC